MSLKTELQEVREEGSGLKSNGNTQEQESSGKRLKVKNVKLRVDTNRGMLWNAFVEFEAENAAEIEEILTDLYDKQLLDTRKKEPSQPYNKGMKS